MEEKKIKQQEIITYFKFLGDISIYGINKGDVFYMKKEKEIKIYVEKPNNLEFQVLLTENLFNDLIKQCDVIKSVECGYYSQIEEHLKNIEHDIKELE